MTNEKSAVERFREKLTVAVRESAGNLVSEAKLGGIALCTDDDLRTVYLVACSREDCASSDDPDFRFLPVEWELEPDGGKPYSALSSQMSTLADAIADVSARREVLFDVLVGALRTLRADSVVSDDVLLLVTSTDPGKQLIGLATSAVEKLNTPEVHQNFVEAEPW